MKRIFIILSFVLMCIIPAAFSADDTDKRIDELSEKVDKLSSELSELTKALQELVVKKNTQENDSADDQETSQTNTVESEVNSAHNEVDNVLKRMEDIVETQQKIAAELDELKDSDSPEILYDENGNEVHLGVVEDIDSEAPVLEEYGNDNNSNEVYYYEEPQYIIPQSKPKVGIRFYFGIHVDIMVIEITIGRLTHRGGLKIVIIGDIDSFWVFYDIMH